MLVARCLKCHGESQQKGQLRLDSREAVLKGGENGEVVVVGKPAESLIVAAINRTGLEMPPDAPLKENEIAALTEWVRRGLPWPTDNGKSRVLTPGGQGITDADKQYWAFQPIRDPSVPDLNSAISNLKFQIRNPIDHFIAAKLVTDGFTPAPEADRRTLIRRLTFDLTGLPPTRSEIVEFESDSRDDAYERLVDRLLDSPAYGERSARHWLDLVRYAESDGYRKDDYRPHTWRYRDYVIRSFQSDKPFDRFVQEQIAGDEIAPENPDALAATGYLRLSLYEYNQRDARTQWNEILNDITDVTGDVFLGFGMGCAMPRSQVRPDLAEGLFSSASLLRRHPAAGHTAAGNQSRDRSSPGQAVRVGREDRRHPRQAVRTRSPASRQVEGQRDLQVSGGNPSDPQDR